MNLKKLFVFLTLFVSVMSLSSFGIKTYVDYEVLNTLEDMKEWVEYDMSECTDSCMTSMKMTLKLAISDSFVLKNALLLPITKTMVML